VHSDFSHSGLPAALYFIATKQEPVGVSDSVATKALPLASTATKGVNGAP